jgi:PAS domain S-box-containing protein
MRQTKLEYLVIALGLLTALGGVTVVIGWTYDISVLKSVLPNQVTMKFNTAVGMFLCGISVIFLSYEPISTLRRFVVFLISFIVGLVSVIHLCEYLFQLQIGLDQWFFEDSQNSLNPGRMSPTTAFCFLNIAIALMFCARSPTLYLRKPMIAALSTTNLIISGLIFISFFPNLLLGTHLLSFANMGIHTAFLFILLGCSLLLLLKSEGDFTWSLNAPITYGCIVWLCSLLAISSAYFTFVNQIKQNDEKIVQTQKAIKELSNFAISLISIDSSEFNYLSTGDKKYLENKRSDLNLVYQSLNKVDKFIDNNTTEQILLNQLKQLISQKFSDVGKSAAKNQKASLNNEIFHTLNQLQDQEDRLFLQQEAKQNTISNHAFLLSPLGIFLSIAMLTIGLFILNFSIGERRKIRAKQKQLAEIVESSDDGIISKNLDSTIISWNHGAEQIFGYSAEEIIGKSILSLIPEDRIHEETDILNQIKSGKKIDHFETIRIRKDGKPIHVSVTVSPIRNRAKEIIGASKIVRDITEKKQLELQLRQSQKMGAIGQLTGGIAHDFNNLLGIILGNLDLLERSISTNEDAKKRVQNALKAATRGAELTKRLLAFSRLQQLAPTPTELGKSINNLVEMANSLLGAQIQIVTQLDNSIPPVFIDPTELESALLNLAVNARDAMPQGGKIVISTKLIELEENYLSVQAGEIKPGCYVCISVADTGEGMSAETQEHVFEPFFTTKVRGKGTGMGLSMVYGFVKQSGGVVRVYSELGHGTTVSLYLPFIKNEQVFTKKSEVLNFHKLTGKALVVDDELDLLEIASFYLKELGFDVVHATDSTHALAIFEHNTDINLLVTDIIMPNSLNGIELAKKIRQLKHDVVVVYTSGFPEGVLSEKNSGKIEGLLINKPYTRELFAHTIFKAMNFAKE